MLVGVFVITNVATSSTDLQSCRHYWGCSSRRLHRTTLLSLVSATGVALILFPHASSFPVIFSLLSTTALFWLWGESSSA